MKTSFTIHDLPAAERPRERLQQLGADSLSIPELLALVLGRGIAGESVAMTAQRLLRDFGNIEGISNASLDELMNVKGIGLAKAAQLKAAFELANRLDKHAAPKAGLTVKTPDQVHSLVKGRLKGKKKEHLLAVLLDTRAQLIRIAQISIGSLDSSIADPRDIFKEAVVAGASSMILVHNHPSGDPRPSQDDIRLTKRLAEAGKTVDIEVLDHVIIGKTGNGDQAKGYFSLKREGLL